MNKLPTSNCKQHSYPETVFLKKYKSFFCVECIKQRKYSAIILQEYLRVISEGPVKFHTPYTAEDYFEGVDEERINL